MVDENRVMEAMRKPGNNKRRCGDVTGGATSRCERDIYIFRFERERETDRKRLNG